MNKFFSYSLYINDDEKESIDILSSIPFIAEEKMIILDEEEYGEAIDCGEEILILQDLVTGKKIYPKEIERENKDEVLRYFSCKEIDILEATSFLKFLNDNESYLNEYIDCIKSAEKLSEYQYEKDLQEKRKREYKVKEANQFIEDFKRKVKRYHE